MNTLSTAQLERKRANDREAQRAIRQRTKDHIDGLEMSLRDLRGSQESNERLVATTQRRNMELEQENAYLRSKLGDPTTMPRPQVLESTQSSVVTHVSYDADRLADQPQQPGMPTSPTAHISAMSIQRPPSVDTSRSLSITTTNSSTSRHGSFQTPAGYAQSAPSLAMSGAAPATGSSNSALSAWRPQEGLQAGLPGPGQVQNPSQHPATMPYAHAQSADRPEWAAPSNSYQYAAYDHLQPHPRVYDAKPALHPQKHQYAQGQGPNFGGPPAPQSHPQAFGELAQTQRFPGPTPPQNYSHPASQPEMLPMSIATGPGYHVPQQQQNYQHSAQQPSYSQPGGTYQVTTPMQVSPAAAGYVSPHGQMQPPPLPGTSYQTSAGYASQPSQPSGGQYRDDGRSYTLPNYPPG